MVRPASVTVWVLPPIGVAPLPSLSLRRETETAVGPPRPAAVGRTVSLERLVYVDLPDALPDVFAGLEQSVTLAVVGAVVAEWVIADRGLGVLILMGSEDVRPDVMFAALAVLLALGLALYGTVVLVQRGAKRWLGLESIGCPRSAAKIAYPALRTGSPEKRTAG